MAFWPTSPLLTQESEAGRGAKKSEAVSALDPVRNRRYLLRTTENPFHTLTTTPKHPIQRIHVASSPFAPSPKQEELQKTKEWLEWRKKSAEDAKNVSEKGEKKNTSMTRIEKKKRT